MSNQFYTPVGINIDQSIYGGKTSYNRSGNLRDSTLSPYPQIQEPYYIFPSGNSNPVPGQLVPGRTVGDYGGPSGVNPTPGTPGGSNTGGNVTNIHINAIDPASFRDVLMRNPEHVGDAVANAFNYGGNAGLETVRRALSGS